MKKINKSANELILMYEINLITYLEFINSFYTKNPSLISYCLHKGYIDKNKAKELLNV